MGSYILLVAIVLATDGCQTLSHHDVVEGGSVPGPLFPSVQPAGASLQSRMWSLLCSELVVKTMPAYSYPVIESVLCGNSETISHRFL